MFRLAFKMFKADDIRVENITALHLKDGKNMDLSAKSDFTKHFYGAQLNIWWFKAQLIKNAYDRKIKTD